MAVIISNGCDNNGGNSYDNNSGNDGQWCAAMAKNTFPSPQEIKNILS